ncbi:MAG: SH3 domain-containing protein [Chloroflexota bacterium]
MRKPSIPVLNRWRLLGALMFISTLILAAPAAAQTEDDREDAPVTGIIAAENLFVYTGPDYAYRLIGQLPLNAAVTVVGRREGGFWGERWLEIAYGDRRAWVFARYVRLSVPYSDIPSTGRPLPRDNNGRVPEGFDVSTNICDTWPVGGTAVSGDFVTGDTVITLTFPPMPGANTYSVFTRSPEGYETRFFSETPTFEIELDRLPTDPGTFTWQAVAYYTNRPERWYWQQLCPRRLADTSFERPPVDE